MFVLGGGTKGKVIGENPDLNNLDVGDLKFLIDFRSVYASLLQDKLHFDLHFPVATLSQFFKDLSEIDIGGVMQLLSVFSIPVYLTCSAVVIVGI